MYIRILLAFATTLCVGTAVSAQELETQKDRFSYTIGYQMGLSLERPGMDLNEEVLIQALRDAMSGADPKLSRNDMDAAIAEQRRLLEGEMQEQGAENLARGEAFLDKNKQRDVVTETGSGLQYEVLTEGDGAQPTESDTVVVHYEGSLIDGSVFDSSYERDNPATLPVNGVIEGWQEALQLMREGAKYKLYIPAALGYGEQGAGNRIGPNEMLIFEVELIEVK